MTTTDHGIRVPARVTTRAPIARRRPSARPSARWLVTAPRLAALAVVALTAAGAALAPGHDQLHDVVRTGLVPSSALAGTVLVVSLVLGLPHGAVDLARLDGSWRERAPVAGLYVVLTGLAAAAWVLDPLVTLLALLALSVAHFGAADLELHDAVEDAPRRRCSRSAVTVAGGGIPVLVPLGLHGAAVLDVLDGLTAGHGQVVITTCRMTLPILAGALVVVSVDAVRRHRWGVVADVAVLLVLFATVGPLLAFAVYFGLWHAWRQTALMIEADARVWGVRRSVAGVRLVRQAAAPSLVSLAVVVVLAVVGDRAVLVWGLAAVLCLTVPHAATAALVGRSHTGVRVGKRTRHRGAAGA